jgi:hypothetical protein
MSSEGTLAFESSKFGDQHCGNFRLSEMLVCYDDPPQIMEKPMPKFPLY